MQVKCIAKTVEATGSLAVIERLNRSIHLDELRDLTIGQIYPVHAVEYRDGGLWIFIDTIDLHLYPDPNPLEMFEIVDSSIPDGWHIQTELEEHGIVFLRMSFPEWAKDKYYFERLFDGDKEAFELYNKQRQAFGQVPG